jgi:hypothetical protein
MAKPFTIRVNSIAAEPLSIDETAEKYGLPSHELRRLKSLVIKREPTSGRLTDSKPATRRKSVSSRRKSPGHR